MRNVKFITQRAPPGKIVITRDRSFRKNVTCSDIACQHHVQAENHERLMAVPSRVLWLVVRA